MIKSFPPIIHRNSEILILGTMPGATSLEKQEYYAYRQNHFWKIIFSLLDALPVPEKFEDKKTLLQLHNIALWDVLQFCEREGSLDTKIKNHVENDIPALLKHHPRIRKIVFNGQLSHKLFLRKFGQLEGICYMVMPSTSPANTMGFEKKLTAWAGMLG